MRINKIDITRVTRPQGAGQELTLKDIVVLRPSEAAAFMRKYQNRHNYRMLQAFFVSERPRIQPGDVFSAVADVHPATGRIQGLTRTPAAIPQAGAVLEFQADRFGLIASGVNVWGLDQAAAGWYRSTAMSVTLPTSTVLTSSPAFMLRPLARAM